MLTAASYVTAFLVVKLAGTLAWLAALPLRRAIRAWPRLLVVVACISGFVGPATYIALSEVTPLRLAFAMIVLPVLASTINDLRRVERAESTPPAWVDEDYDRDAHGRMEKAEGWSSIVGTLIALALLMPRGAPYW